MQTLSPSPQAYVLDGQRLAALSESGLLTPDFEPAFDRWTRLAGDLIQAPIALLSLVALFVDANATVTHWWRTFLFTVLGWGALIVPVVLAAFAAEMWFGLLRRSMAAPIGGGLIAFAALLALLQHYQRGNVAAGEGAGGALGSLFARLAAGAFGDATDRFEATWYGHRPSSAADVAEVRRLASEVRASVREREPVAAP